MNALVSTDTFNSRGTDCVCVNRSTEWKAWTSAHVYSFTTPGSRPALAKPRISMAFGVDNLHFARPRGRLADHLAGIVARGWFLHLWEHTDPAWWKLTGQHREFTVNVREDQGRGSYRAFIAFREHTAHCTQFAREHLDMHMPPQLDTIDRLDYTPRRFG